MQLKNSIYKLSLISFLILGATSSLFSQNVANDTSAQNIRNSLLIIPFRPDLYYNEDASYMVAESKLSYDQILNYFRLTLDEKLISCFKDSCTVNSLLSSQTMSSEEEVEEFYAAVNYFMDDIMLPDTGQKTIFTALRKRKSTKKEKVKDPGNHPGELVSPAIDVKNKFVNIRFSNTRLVPSIAASFNADILLFINQLEIKGDYSDPQKVINGTNDLMVNIHFSVFNKGGDYLSGALISERYPAWMHLPEKIAETYFPQLASQIMLRIPLHQ